MNPNQVAAKVVPDLGDGISVTAGVSSWVYGDYVEIIADDVEPDFFIPKALSVESASLDTTYQLQLVHGSDDIPCGVCRFTRGSYLNAIPIDGQHVPAKSRVRVRAASSSGGGTVVFSLNYQPCKSVVSTP